MDSGYDPARVHELRHRTSEAIALLSSLRSDDPMAADALRAVRLTQRNLEELWMPALREIERSDVMVRWRASHLIAAGPRWRAHDLRRASDEQLEGHLDWLERRRASGRPLTEDDLETLARELALRVATDADLASRLLQRAASRPLVAELLPLAEFPVSFVAGVIRTMMWPHGPVGTADLDAHAAALDSAISALIDRPGACLDLLADPQVVHGLAAWRRLDADVLARFVGAGLYDAVVADPARLGDGYAVLRTLTELANGPLDEGFHPGVALGVSSSLAGYVDTLAPALRQEGATPVVIRDHDLRLELGTYDDLVDLFGALVRDPASQAALGTVLGGYTFEVIHALGADLTRRPGLTHVTALADLVGDATRGEQAELVMVAAADEARRRRLGGLIGFGVGTALIAAGVGSVARAVSGRAITMAAEWAARVEPDSLPDDRIPAQVHDLIVVAALEVVVATPSVRRQLGVGDVTSTQWGELDRRITAIRRQHDPRRRAVEVGDLEHWIETEVPPLAGYVLELRKMPGMDELTEGRNAVGAD